MNRHLLFSLGLMVCCLGCEPRDLRRCEPDVDTRLCFLGERCMPRTLECEDTSTERAVIIADVVSPTTHLSRDDRGRFHLVYKQGTTLEYTMSQDGSWEGRTGQGVPLGTLAQTSPVDVAIHHGEQGSLTLHVAFIGESGTTLELNQVSLTAECLASASISSCAEVASPDTVEGLVLDETSEPELVVDDSGKILFATLDAQDRPVVGTHTPGSSTPALEVMQEGYQDVSLALDPSGSVAWLVALDAQGMVSAARGSDIDELSRIAPVGFPAGDVPVSPTHITLEPGPGSMWLALVHARDAEPVVSVYEGIEPGGEGARITHLTGTLPRARRDGPAPLLTISSRGPVYLLDTVSDETGTALQIHALLDGAWSDARALDLPATVLDTSISMQSDETGRAHIVYWDRMNLAYLPYLPK